MALTHAQEAIEQLTDDNIKAYALMVVEKITGTRKSLVTPKKFGLDSKQAKHIRGLIDNDMLRGEAIEVRVPPLPTVDPVKQVPERFSLSLMQAAENCMLSARLQREFDASGAPAIVGRIVHEVCDVLALQAHRDGIARFTPDLAEGLANMILEDPQEVAPLAITAYAEVIEMVRRWADRMVFWTDADVFLTEELVTMNLGGQMFSGKVDLTQVRGDQAKLDDYKTGMRPPTQAEYEQKLQLPFYATALRNQLPWVTSWDLGEVWLRWSMPRLTVVLATQDLHLEEYLTIAGKRLHKAWVADDLPADPGPHCKNCALPERCPLPRALRPDAAFDTVDQARDGLAWLIATEAQVKKVKTSVRGFMERNEIEQLEVGKSVAVIETKMSESLDGDRTREWIAANGGDVDQLTNVGSTNRFDIKALDVAA